MKAGELTDDTINHTSCPVVVEDRQGNRKNVSGFYMDTNERNELVMVIVTGKNKIKKCID